MDRIKIALEKNKLQKEKNRINDSANILGQNSGPVNIHDNIEYTHTKSIAVSQTDLAENRIIAGNRSDPRSISFQLLRTQVLQKMRENGWSTLAVTGATPGVGKSFVAINLAISISLEVNQTVLLVDMDLRHPSLHEYFNFEPEYGLLDYLKGSVNIRDVFINPSFERLVLLPGKGSSNESSELSSSPKMLELINDLKSRYESRIIIFDLPPLLNTDDAIVFLPNVDSTLLVVENGKNTKSEVQSSMRILQGSNLIGTVLNKNDQFIHKGY